LTDVPGQEHQSQNSSESSWKLAFQKSRWFTKGWILQELLAPPSAEFFSAETSQRLGDRASLEEQISETTGIPIGALRGHDLSLFSVDQRMLWAQHRETTRKEDKAYSVTGIFGVYIPILYGEGREGAFERLREEIYRRPIRQIGNRGDPSSAFIRSEYLLITPCNAYQGS